jgi:transcriptional antiterminator RfaH
MSLAWYVLHSKPNKEDFLYSQLNYRKVKAFYPRLHVTPVNPRSRKIKPFFPGYLFVNLDLEEIPLSSLAYVPGVNRIVSFDDQPATVPDEVITTIEHNVMRLNQSHDDGAIGLKHGDPVIILDGPFKGYKAIFDTAMKGSDRVRLLVKFLHGQQKRVQVPASMARAKNP